MLIKPITYTTFDGVEVTENFYFNMTKAELMVMMLEHESKTSNFEKDMRTIAESGDGKIIMPAFKNIIAMSYGERSDDGKYFHKSDEISKAFEGHAAYDVLLSEMLEDPEKRMAEFIDSIMPQALLTAARRDADAQAAETPQPAVAEPEKTPSQLARERSEARLQGHKPKEQPKQSSVTIEKTAEPQFIQEDDDPAAGKLMSSESPAINIEHNQLMEDERRELEELRRLRDERARQQ